MTDKLVYQAISAVAKEMATTGISKDRTNTQQNFKFRGIDQVYNALAPALVNHGLLILPRITERTVTERTTPKGTVLFYVVVKAEFDFVSTKDGSVHTVVTYGEAMDSGDKATNKAMSIAYKYAAFQAFCIPTEETAIDADAEVHHIQPADADTILAEFTQYAGTENDAKKLQEQYASTWTRLNGFPEHQAKCKDVTGIRIKELKQAA
ncbi:ERF family protein [Cronobacter sakazakii]|uniref:ERF family protein n=1 Tax=Cronobacter sakazakii TaxID=28141 RepID=UPI0005780EE9|nr:ERF family protein [Cronobacter sakazakii]EGT4427678.1 single-stranded DNA-binding protein [Cronobacter sakazakii]ELY4040054.1 ERF family protein [Cronobacter sakazakii]ELY4514274.1 ERF family protein [Cronobacter sakazakii]ELY6004908.1 ERF family protein [Cronobacter sakazakii]EMC4349334.1 ERF family protein [Cronobacter sakazakii]